MRSTLPKVLHKAGGMPMVGQVLRAVKGAGNAKILESLGVDKVGSGGQTMNPSTADLLEAVKGVNAGLLTMTDAHVASAVRRSYPVSDAFPAKFFDLDRCFEVLRIPVDIGKVARLDDRIAFGQILGGKRRAVRQP